MTTKSIKSDRWRLRSALALCIAAVGIAAMLAGPPACSSDSSSDRENQPDPSSDLADTDANMRALEGSLPTNPQACVDYIDLCERASSICAMLGDTEDPNVVDTCAGITQRCEANIDAYCSGGADGGVDSGADGGVDSGADGGVDSGADGGVDSGADGWSGCHVVISGALDPDVAGEYAPDGRTSDGETVYESVTTHGGSDWYIYSMLVGNGSEHDWFLTPLANLSEPEWGGADPFWVVAGPGNPGLAGGVLQPFAGATGNAIVTFDCGDPVAVTGVTIAPTSAAVPTGATRDFTATVTPVGATNTSVSWSVLGSGTGSISSSGTYTAPAIVPADPVTVRVTTDEGAFTADALVTVTSAGFATRDVAGWKTRLDAVWGAEVTYCDTMSSSQNSRDFYFVAHCIDAGTAMFEATGDRTYLDYALRWAQNMVDDARVAHSLDDGPVGPNLPAATYAYPDDYLGWVGNDSLNGGGGGTGMETPLYDTFAFRYVARMLRVIHDTPAIHNLVVPGTGQTYLDRYESILAFTEVHVFEKWFSRNGADYWDAGEGGGLHGCLERHWLHMACNSGLLSFELAILTSNATRRADMVHVYNWVTDLVKRNVLDNPSYSGAAWWHGFDGASSGPSDTDHANQVPAMIVEAFLFGSRAPGATAWTQSEIDQQVSLLVHVLSHGNSMATCLDGSSGGCGDVGGPYWMGDGFVKLGRLDLTGAAQAALEEYEPGGYMAASYYANGALNASLLGL